jgi:hypothetical protein
VANNKTGMTGEQIFLNECTNYKKCSNYTHDPIDFKHKTKLLYRELKTVNYNFTDFHEWMISVKKLIVADKLYKKGIYVTFYMLCYDGLFFWRYRPQKYNKKNVRPFSRVDRGKTETEDYLYIDSSEWTKSRHQICNPLDLSSPRNVSECMIDTDDEEDPE